MSILQEATGPISSINVPRLWPDIDGYRIVNGTGELEPQDFHALLSLEKQIDYGKRKALVRHWQTLVSQNAPLRAVVNGLPCSVPEDFYDYFLYVAFPERNFKIVEAVGRALRNGPGGVSDWWYAHSIRHLITCGELEVVESGKNLYCTTVRKLVHQSADDRKTPVQRGPIRH